MKKLLILSLVLISFTALAFAVQKEIQRKILPRGGIQYANIKTGVEVTKLPNNQYVGYEISKGEDELNFLRSGEEKPSQGVLKSVYELLETQYNQGL